tara:strand:+ start:4043 stop:4408 length:366 start_codon:yes stop_codon:yes gene_type:complete
MNDNLLQNFRYNISQDYLPVGFAILNRIKERKFLNIVDVFKDYKLILHHLRIEGQVSAKSFMDQLDNLNLGLGNPIIPINNIEKKDEDLINRKASIKEKLTQIQNDLDQLKSLLIKKKSIN